MDGIWVKIKNMENLVFSYMDMFVLSYGMLSVKIRKIWKKNSSLLQDKNKEYITSKHIYGIWRRYLGEI